MIGLLSRDITNRLKASETLLGIETYTRHESGCDRPPLQSLWNPFRDWNYLWKILFRRDGRLQSLWNPFRDWNWSLRGWRFTPIQLQSLWNPFRDWNIALSDNLLLAKLLQSLWNPFRDWNKSRMRQAYYKAGFKASETLLGIETKELSLP